MSYTVSATDLGRLRFNEADTVNSVLQNIAVILSTPKGSVPLYREFGIPFDILDKPIPIAKNMIIAPVREAIERWEPRATFVDIRFSGDVSQPGSLIPIVEVEIHAEES